MNTQRLIDTVEALVAGNKGLLAMDESNPTCNKRFATLGILQTEEARRAYEVLLRPCHLVLRFFSTPEADGMFNAVIEAQK